MRKQRNMFQMKTKDKTSEKYLDAMEISNVPDKELKEIVIKMLTKIGEIGDQQHGKYKENTKQKSWS